jgi:hypothetical protein
MYWNLFSVNDVWTAESITEFDGKFTIRRLRAERKLWKPGKW